MSQSSALAHFEPLIRNLFEEGRCGEYYLVDLEIFPTNKIVVYIDGDEGVSLEACTQISRILESVLDEEPTLGGVYELEVSSPGVSRPLRFPRQYLKHVGRTLKVDLNDSTSIEGQLTNTGNESITLTVKGKDKKASPDLQEIPYEKIKGAYVVVQFGKK